jgi:hypothetical protein
MESQTVSHARTLAGVLLNQPVTDWVIAQRNEGKSWRAIALELHLATNGVVSVSDQTIRNWAGQDAA